MKLRRLPEDFQVEERSSVALGDGPYALYRLTKRSRDTLEVVATLAKLWRLPRQALSFGGLKDRHAVTTQFLTVPDGPRSGVSQPGLTVEYLGQTPGPFTSEQIIGNRFAITLRELKPAMAEAAAAALAVAAEQGVPNYFDDQRFGSLGSSGEFMARAWCLGDHEGALRLALVDPNPHDGLAERRDREALAKHWGDWPVCLPKLVGRTPRNVAAVLVKNPADFRRAIAQIPAEERGLYLAAFQSALWNALADVSVRRHGAPSDLARLPIAGRPLTFPKRFDEAHRDELLALELPLPSARIEVAAGPVADLLKQVLAAHGLEQRQLRVKYPRDSFFARGVRAALVRPEEATATILDDELYRGFQRVDVRFSLPRAAYATIVVKRMLLDFPQELTSRTTEQRKMQRKTAVKSRPSTERIKNGTRSFETLAPPRKVWEDEAPAEPNAVA